MERGTKPDNMRPDRPASHASGQPSTRRAGQSAARPTSPASRPVRHISRERAEEMRREKTEKKLGTALYYAFEILVDVVILFILVRGFSLAFHFSHDVFYDQAAEPGSKEYKTIRIEKGFTDKSVAKELADAGLVKNRYVMQAKIRIGEYSGKIGTGTYQLSPSMTAKEILNTICGLDEKDDSDTDTVSSPSDAEPGDGKIIDNSNAGAGAGGAEEDSGDLDSGSGDSSSQDGSSGNHPGAE